MDDEADIRFFTSLALKAAGLCCDQAADGLEALEAIAQTPYDLIVLDADSLMG